MEIPKQVTLNVFRESKYSVSFYPSCETFAPMVEPEFQRGKLKGDVSVGYVEVSSDLVAKNQNFTYYQVNECKKSLVTFHVD